MKSLLTKHKQDLAELDILWILTDHLVSIEDSLIVTHVMWKFEKWPKFFFFFVDHLGCLALSSHYVQAKLKLLSALIKEAARSLVKR